MTSPDLLQVGRIGKAHGLKGEVMVHLTTDRAERVEPGAVLHAPTQVLTVRAARPHQGNWIVAFEGVEDRNAAELLRGLVLSAEPIDDPDAVWVHDLVGSVVVTPDGVEHGEIASVEANPASDLLVLVDGRLIPMNFVVATLPGRVTVDVPDGLLDLT
jgi:16S rRNA processing protein RimM